MAHGVITRETATASFGVREAPSATPFIVGTAPKGSTETIEKLGSLADAAETFGQRREQDDAWDFSLARFAEIFFQLYGSQPVYAVNVVDPSSDTASITDESQTFENGELRTANAHLVDGTVTVTDDGGGTTYDEGTDYEVDLDKGLVTRVDGGSISAGETVNITYDHVDPSVISSSDIVGGETNGDRTGLELIEEVFPKFGDVPGLILAPGYSHESSVASAIAGKAGGFSAGFKAHGLVDIDSDTDTTVSDAVDAKGSLTTSPDVSVYWPKVDTGSVIDWLSAHAAGVIARTDRTKGGDLPFVSPSNEDLEIAGTDVTVTFQESQTLGDNGLVTAFRRGSAGFQLFNNNTAAFPGTTDVKDRFIANSRMATFIANSLILSVFQKVDDPLNERLIDSVVASVNQTINGWEAQGALLGGKVLFLQQDNPTTDLQNGQITFRILYAVPTPAEEIEFVLEVDVGQYETLFE